MSGTFYCGECKRDMPREDMVRINQFRRACRECAARIRASRRMTPAQRDSVNQRERDMS